MVGTAGLTLLASLFSLCGIVWSAPVDDYASCQQTDDIETSISACTRIVEDKNAKREDQAMMYLRRGYDYYLQGKDERAVIDYTRSIEIGPQNIFAYANRALVYERMGDRRRALEDVQRARLLDASQFGSLVQSNADLMRLSKLTESTPSATTTVGRDVALSNGELALSSYSRKATFAFTFRLSIPDEIKIADSIPSSKSLSSSKVNGSVSYLEYAFDAASEAQSYCRNFLRNWLQGEDWNRGKSASYELIDFWRDERGSCSVSMREIKRKTFWNHAEFITEHCPRCAITLDLNTATKPNNEYLQRLWSPAASSLKEAAATVK